MLIFPGVCALLLTLALAAGQFLHGGYLYAAFAWPGTIAVCAASYFAAAGSLRDERLPDVRLGGFLLTAFVGWFLFRWFSTGSTSPGFLPVVICTTGFFSFLIVAFGMRGAGMRLLLVVGILLLGILQMVELGAWRITNQGLMDFWFSEQLRIWQNDQINRRTSGFYLSKNHFAWFMNACAMFALGLCVWARIPAYFKFLSGWAAGFFAFGCILSLSRGGAIGLGAGLLSFTMVSLLIVVAGRSRFRKFSISFLAFVLAALTGGILWLILGNYAVQERLSMIGADVYREEQWKSVVRQFESAPMAGTGTGTFADYSRLYRPWRLVGGESIYAHNDLLQTAAETGWTGFGLLVLAVCAITAASLRGLIERVRARRDETLVQSNHCAVVVGAIATLGAFAAHSIFDNNMHLAPNGLLAFIVLGLVASGAPPIRVISSGLARKLLRFVPAVLLFAGATIFLIWSFPRFTNELLFVRLQNEYLRNRPALAFALAEKVNPGGGLGSASLYLAAADVWQSASALPAAASDPVLSRSLLERAEENCMAAHKPAALDRYPRLRAAAVRSLLGNHPDAFRSAMEAIELDPQSAFVYEYMGGVLEAAGFSREALRYYSIAIDTGRASAFPVARARAIRESLQSSNPRP